MDNALTSHPAAPGLIPGVPEVFSDKFFRKKLPWWKKTVDFAEVNQERCCIEQWTAGA